MQKSYRASLICNELRIEFAQSFEIPTMSSTTVIAVAKLAIAHVLNVQNFMPCRCTFFYFAIKVPKFYQDFWEATLNESQCFERFHSLHSSHILQANAFERRVKRPVSISYKLMSEQVVLYRTMKVFILFNVIFSSKLSFIY